MKDNYIYMYLFQDATEPFGVQATVTLKTNYWDTKVIIQI